MGEPRIIPGSPPAEPGAAPAEQDPHQYDETEQPGDDDHPLAGFPQVRQVAVYRKSPEWAAGHITTMQLLEGQTFGEHQLDEISAYYGGGLYQLRPLGKHSRFIAGTVTIRIDGPALYKGQPHPNDPNAWKTQQAPQSQPAPPTALGNLPAVHVPRENESALVNLLGQLIDKAIDQRQPAIAPSVPAPAPASNPIAQLGETLKLFKAMKEIFEPQHDFEGAEEDDEDDEDEVAPGSMEEVITRIVEKKFLEDDDEQQPQSAGGPRLIRAGTEEAGKTAPVKAAPKTVTNTSAPRAETSGVPFTTEGLIAIFEKLGPEAKAEIVAQTAVRVTTPEEQAAVRAAFDKIEKPAG